MPGKLRLESLQPRTIRPMIMACKLARGASSYDGWGAWLDATMPENYRQVALRALNLDGRGARTAAQIADEGGVSVSAVRQMKSKALRRYCTLLQSRIAQRDGFQPQEQPRENYLTLWANLGADTLATRIARLIFYRGYTTLSSLSGESRHKLGEIHHLSSKSLDRIDASLRASGLNGLRD